MRYILVASPDKISLKNFTEQLLIFLKVDCFLGPIHYLMSDDSIQSYVDHQTQKVDVGVFTFFARKCVTKEPLTKIPFALIRKMDIIVWFDLYSTEIKVLKDDKNEIGPMVELWGEYMKRMGV